MNHDHPPREAAPPQDTPPKVARRTGASTSRPTARKKLKEPEKIRVWVRAGGTCVLCKQYLLDGPLTGLEVPLGELAHIVGQQDSDRSPRGRHAMPRNERDNADNVLLACERCHEEIDDQLVTGILDAEQLNRIKASHERRIRHVTTLPDDQRTLVLRMVGQLRGNAVEVTRAAAAEAVIDSGKFPWFDLDRDRLGVEIDLTGLPGEDAADDLYYATARRAIDKVMDHKLDDAVKAGHVRHVSVFAFARLPLLVYLGWKLDDNYGVEVYQRHRSSESWQWPSSPSQDLTFSCESVRTGPADATDGVLLTNLTGTAYLTDLPAELAGAPAWELTPDNGAIAEDVIAAPADLANFQACVRAIFAGLEATNKAMRQLHVFGPLPLSAAVVLGRALKAADLRPALVIYDRTSAGYVKALEV